MNLTCTCPTVEINAHKGHVSKKDLRTVADLLKAQVQLTEFDGETFVGTQTIWGKHRDECPIKLTARK